MINDRHSLAPALFLQQNFNILSTNFETDADRVAFRKVFCFADVRPDGHKVEAVFREQGRFPLAPADPDTYRDHSPAIRHECRYGFQGLGLLFRDGHEEPRGRALPEPDLAAKLDVHGHSISNGFALLFVSGLLRLSPFMFTHCFPSGCSAGW